MADKKNKKAGPSNRAVVQSATRRAKKFSFSEYFKGVKLEMKKVVWPTKSDMKSYTVIVIAVCLFFSVSFWLIDTGLLAGLRALLGITV